MSGRADCTICGKSVSRSYLREHKEKCEERYDQWLAENAERRSQVTAWGVGGTMAATAAAALITKSGAWAGLVMLVALAVSGYFFLQAEDEEWPGREP